MIASSTPIDMVLCVEDLSVYGVLLLFFKEALTRRVLTCTLPLKGRPHEQLLLFLQVALLLLLLLALFESAWAAQ